MQQALGYADSLDIPFVFSSNGDGILFHDRTVTGGKIELELPMNGFPPPEALWSRYRTWKGIGGRAEEIVEEDYYDDGGEKKPRYY